VRIVGGEARGRRLAAPAGRATRPTSDRVREAIFGVLGSLEATAGVSVEGARVVDLFAGSGAMGIEALSRGAAAVTFVERDRAAVAAVRANLAATGLAGPGVTVVSSDAERWLARGERSDLILCDPPYAYSAWPDLLAAMAPLTRLAVIETGGPMDLGPAWDALKIKRYGSTVVSIARPAGLPGRLDGQANQDQEGGT
jgi:16S rRNA (guanine966-N2)-methyltransferase